MRKLLVGTMLALVPLIGLAAGGIHLEKARVDLNDQAALQRGAKYFMNYCSGCHSLKHARYNRMGKDIGLDEDQVANNLMFLPGAKVGDNIGVAMQPQNSLAWFGVAIPDLTLVTRNKVGGPNWLYTYLKGFYLDPTRPYGVNNTVFPNVGMPDMLWQLRGTQKAVYTESVDAAGNPVKVFTGLERVSEGALTEEQFDRMVLDLTTFLTYMGEPMQLERQTLGYYVILFLVLFTMLAYLLKREYWKDVH